MCFFTDLQAHPSSQEAPRTSSESIQRHNTMDNEEEQRHQLCCYATTYWLMQVNRDHSKHLCLTSYAEIHGKCFSFLNLTYLNWWLWAYLQNSSISIHVDTKNKFLKVHFNLSWSSCDVRLQSKTFCEPCVRRTLLITFSGTLSVIGVNIKPGSTQLHLIPNLDNHRQCHPSLVFMLFCPFGM